MRVVVGAPRCDLVSSIEQIPKPAHVQALIAKPAMKAFDVSILRRLARLNVNRVDLPLDAPRQKMPRKEFRAIVPAEWSWHGVDTLETPGRRIRQRRDATGAPTQRPESLGTATAVPELPGFWRESDKSQGLGDGVPI